MAQTSRGTITFSAQVRQGIFVDADGRLDPEAFIEPVLAAERLGYEHVLVADHVFVPEYWSKVIGDMWIEPFTLLSYIAARTTRIELVLACLVVPYRQPIAVAKAIASLDQLSGGRAALGVVAGYLKEEFDAFGIPLDERGPMTDEFIRIMINLWSQPGEPFQGRYYDYQDIELKPGCVRTPHVPLWVGGNSKAARRRVAEFGTVWNPLGYDPVTDGYRDLYADSIAGKPLPSGNATPESLRRGIAEIRELADASGRDLADLEVVVNLKAPGEGAEAVDLLGEYVDAGATGFVVAVWGETAPANVEFLEKFDTEIIRQL